MPVPGLRLDPPVPIPDHVLVQHADEPVHRDAREAAFVEELLPGTAEAPLRGGVVRTASLRTRRARQTMLLADADPLRPPVVAAMVEMDDWFLAVPEHGARVGEHAVGQCRVRVGADRPCDRKPVVAVDHGRQAGLAREDGKLREVRDPQHVRPFGVTSPQSNDSDRTLHIGPTLKRFLYSSMKAIINAVPGRAWPRKKPTSSSISHSPGAIPRSPPAAASTPPSPPAWTASPPRRPSRPTGCASAAVIPALSPDPWRPVQSPSSPTITTTWTPSAT